MELLHSPNEIIDPQAPKSLASREVTLSVESLSFSYSTRPNVNVLENVSFRAVPGEMIAVVGPSGAGKSTLFDLMQRFYVPSAGSIKLDGIDTAELKLQELRGRMGFVPQDPVRFAGSIRENLLYANAQARPEVIDEALHLAHAIDFVTKLPDQLATVIGEGGVGLSGGERQRLAIARALISNPSVLLLDEATSALDAESEHHIRLSIDGLKGQMTIVVIAHRLSTVRQADRILVLDEGRLLSSGSHEELMASSDLYAKFAKIQFAA